MTSTQTIQLDQLDSRIRSVWGRAQILHLLAGLLILLRWATPLFLLGVFIDWMTYMPTSGRVVILSTLLILSFYRAWRGGWRHLRLFDARRTALQLESHHGDLDSLLISALQFRDMTPVSGGADALRNRTFRLAEEAASSLQPKQAVPFNALRRPGAAARNARRARSATNCCKRIHTAGSAQQGGHAVGVRLPVGSIQSEKTVDWPVA
jgi:hypothetical protein